MAQTVQELLSQLLQYQGQQVQYQGQQAASAAQGTLGGLGAMLQAPGKAIQAAGQTELSPGGIAKGGMEVLKQILPGKAFMDGASKALKKKAKEDEKRGANIALETANEIGLDQATQLLQNAQQFITQKPTIQDPVGNALDGNSSLLPPGSSIMEGIPDKNTILSMQDPNTQAGLNDAPQQTQELGQDFISKLQGLGPLGRMREGFAQALTGPIQAQSLQNLLAKQKLEGKEKFQESDREKHELETARAVKLKSMENLFSGKISDREKQIQTQQAFENDLENLVVAWNDLGMGKGGVGGRLGGLSAGTIGHVFGTGREARAKFESVSNGVLYSVGSYVLGQSGRALVEADLKRLEKMAKFTPSMKREDFMGKMQSILDFANSKVSAAGGEVKYKNASDLLNSVRDRKNQAISSSTPKVISFQIIE